MKKFVKLSQSSSQIVVNNIIFDNAYGTIEERSVCIMTLDFENNTHTDKIIDIKVNEKQ